MTNARLVLLHVLSPLHCGTGQAVSGIDLPIARERATRIPIVPGSSLKGVLRARGDRDELHLSAFGPDTEHASDYAGALQFSDLRVVLLPVRSLRGTFAWATSPYLLTRLARDAKEASVRGLPTFSEDVKTDHALVGRGSVLREGVGKIILEELDFSASESEVVGKLGKWLAENVIGGSSQEQDAFAHRFVVLPDDAMTHLLESGTEITTRVRLDPDTKTVANGALWTEEALPVETVLSGLLVATPVQERSKRGHDAAAILGHAEKLAHGPALQIGGKATVGRGLCSVRLIKGDG